MSVYIWHSWAGRAVHVHEVIERGGIASARCSLPAAEPVRIQEIVFVSNPGICPFHAFLDMPAQVLERTLRVNLHGAFYMVQAAANRMKDQGRGGSIIAISSISALVGGEMQTHHTPTKARVHSLMQSCAIALGRYGIRCNSVLPGTILTEINRDDLADPAKREYMEGRIPLGRLGQPEDCAGAIVFFASDLSRYCSGSALLVDGGMFVNLQ